MSDPLYFSNDKFTLYLDDAFNALNKIEEKSVDLIFADPPYFLSSGGISCHSGKQVKVDKGEWDKSLNIEDRLNFNRKWIRICRNVLKDDGTILISGTLHNIYTVGVALEMEGFSIINNITWVKPNPAPNLACRCLTNSTETILWARKQLTSKRKGKHCFNYNLMKELNGGKQMKDVWTYKGPSKNEKKYGKHPTQKPIDLMLNLILMSTKENDLVLDPFCGSGTTGVASVRLNRRFIGIDNFEEYIELSKKRILDEIEQN